MAKVLAKVDTPYEKEDGSKSYAFGLEYVDASDDSAKKLVSEGKAEYANEEDQEAYDQEVSEATNDRVSAVDESLRASSSQGQKFGDAFASNNSPAGDTDISDPTGESGVQPEPVNPAFRLGAEANTLRQAPQESTNEGTDADESESGESSEDSKAGQRVPSR
jgi:hypothetical protein